MSLDKPVSAVSDVMITIPACHSHLGVVRLATSGVAAVYGFDIGRIEDIKTAVCEACYYLIGLAHRAPSLCVGFTFDEAEHALCIMAKGVGEADVSSEGRTIDPQMAACVLETLVDKASLSVAEDGNCMISMRVQCVRAPEVHEHA